MQIGTHKTHPLADEFPLIEGEEFDKLAESIGREGLLHDIELDVDGRIIDGRNRLRACLEAKVEPRFKTVTVEGEALILYVFAKNLARRHLDAGQRAMVGAAIEALLAKSRKRGRPEGSTKAQAPEITEEKKVVKLPPFPEKRPLKAREEAAQVVGVSPVYIQRAKVVKRVDPELADMVRDGVISLNAAYHKVSTHTKLSDATPKRFVSIDEVKLVVEKGDSFLKALNHYIDNLEANPEEPSYRQRLDIVLGQIKKAHNRLK